VLVDAIAANACCLRPDSFAMANAQRCEILAAAVMSGAPAGKLRGVARSVSHDGQSQIALRRCARHLTSSQRLSPQCAGRLAQARVGAGRGGGAAAVASFVAGVLTGLYLGNVCSCQEILRRSGRGQLGLIEELRALPPAQATAPGEQAEAAAEAWQRSPTEQRAAEVARAREVAAARRRLELGVQLRALQELEAELLDSVRRR
jgi:hypothetical protein